MIEFDAEFMHPDPKPMNMRHAMHTTKKTYFSKSTAYPKIGKEKPKNAQPMIKVCFLPLLLRR